MSSSYPDFHSFHEDSPEVDSDPLVHETCVWNSSIHHPVLHRPVPGPAHRPESSLYDGSAPYTNLPHSISVIPTIPYPTGFSSTLINYNTLFATSDPTLDTSLFFLSQSESIQTEPTETMEVGTLLNTNQPSADSRHEDTITRDFNAFRYPSAIDGMVPLLPGIGSGFLMHQPIPKQEGSTHEPPPPCHHQHQTSSYPPTPPLSAHTASPPPALETFYCNAEDCQSRGPYYSKPTFQRHQNKHTLPFRCPHNHCKRNRHIAGFSRIDNLKTHLAQKEHRDQTCCGTGSSSSSNSSPLSSSAGLTRKDSAKIEKRSAADGNGNQKMLKSFFLVMMQMMKDGVDLDTLQDME